MYGGLFGDLPSAKKKQQDGDSTIIEEKKRVQVPPPPPEESRPKHSAVAGLGAAGTSMAFLPTTIRPRNKPKAVKIKSSSQQKPNMSVSNMAKVQAEPSPTIKKEEPSSPKVQVKIEDSSNGVDSTIVIENIHGVSIQNNDRSRSPDGEDEMQQLHTSVTDPYDPLIPNDLLAYRERKALEQERWRLEREARETMERQERLRQQLQQERRRIQESGNVSDLIQHHATAQHSMGRGRGVNNLPAWLIKKQREEQEFGRVGGVVSSTTISTTRTVILCNLTAPGDIDDDLGEEVKEECEEKCGPVEAVQVKDAQPPQQPEVQVWVRFKTVVDANKAVTLFQGRMFGQRRIAAKRESE